MIHRLFNIIQLFKEYFVFALLIFLSLLLLSLNDNHQIRSIRSYTVGMIGFMQGTLSIIPNVWQLQQENRVLREVDVNLSDEVNRLRESRLENARLRGLLGMRDRSPFRMVPADVVGKSLQLMRNTITMNIGSAQNVKPDMPIISYSGLVGRVISVSENYSVGQIIANKDFRASALIQRSRVECILTWTGNGETVKLKNVSKKQDVRLGDIVVTSGYSSFYPPNIVIGMVSSVVETPGSLFKDVEATLSTDFSTLEQVFIILQTADPERAVLEQKTNVH